MSDSTLPFDFLVDYHASSFSRSRPDTYEDLVQEGRIKTLRISKGRSKDVPEDRGYVSRSIYNHLIDHIRFGVTRQPVTLPGGLSSDLPDKADIDRTLYLERAYDAKKVLGLLDKEELACFLAVYRDGMTIREAGEHIGINFMKVQRRNTKSMRKIRAYIGE